MSSIKGLQPSVRDSLRSSIVLFDLPRIVEELTYNSVDSGATEVHVSISAREGEIIVEDDGCGITRDVLVILGERYATSKINPMVDKQANSDSLGFKGETLASLSDVSLVEVRTKVRGRPNAYCKIMKGSKCLFFGIDDRREARHGRSLWLMHGLYRANGGCGYVKKPDFLLEAGPNGVVFDPKVKVYMGDGWRMDFSKTRFDSYSPPDLYTRIGIAGMPADTRMKKTRTIPDNWTPVWNEEFLFPLTVPELALLRIEVLEYDMSDKDDFGGQTCLPVSGCGRDSVPCRFTTVRA